MFLSTDAEAARAFMRDVLRLPCTDVGGGWLIFDLPEADVGVHPVEPGEPGGAHDVSFYCDDIEGTVAELEKRGVEFRQPPADHGYGYVTYFTIPGGIEVQLYEPKYAKAKAKSKKAPAKRTPKKAAKKRAVSAPARRAGKRPAKGKPAKRAKRRAR